jgi:peptidylprolyl isomerase
MAQAKLGDTVKVHYTIKLGDGTIIGSTANQEPLQFTIGDGQIIPGFDQAVVGMNPGESRTVQIPADQAFGPHLEEMVVMVERKNFPTDWKPRVGEQVQFKQEDGAIISLMVTDTSEANVTLDGNHPLAGKDLTFDIQFLGVI